VTAPTKFIKCAGCGEEKPPAMKHAIFCAECKERMENAPPAPVEDAAGFFARIKRDSDFEARARTELGL
jgi:hypothetical protein